MVTVDEIGKVRRAYWVQGKKIKAIARETGLSRGTVRRYAQRWRQEHSAESGAAFVPLIYPSGESYQFDWSHEIVILDGVTTEVKVAHIVARRGQLTPVTG